MRMPGEMIGSIYSLMFRGFYSTAFQPFVDTGTGRPIGYESLLRGPEGTPLADPGRLFNEEGYLPEDVRLRLDRACIESAVRTEGTCRTTPCSSSTSWARRSSV